MKKIVLALAVLAATGSALAQEASVILDSPATGPGSLVDNIRNYPKDPESVGKLMGVYVAGMAATYTHCEFEDARIEKMRVKTDRIVSLHYGTLPLAQRVSFARGYFLAEEALADYLNTLPEASSKPMCTRMAREEKATHKYLDEQLVGFEKLVAEGKMTAADIYEGRLPKEPLTPASEPAAQK